MVLGRFEELLSLSASEAELWSESLPELSGESLEFELTELRPDSSACRSNSRSRGDK